MSLSLITIIIKDWNKPYKLLEEINSYWLPTTCYLLRSLYAGQEATVRTGHGTMDGLQIGKRVHQGCILSSCLFNVYADCIMWNARLDKLQAGIKIARKIINNLRYADDTTILMVESRDTTDPLDEGKRGEWKSWIKTQYSKLLRLWHPVPSHGK